MQIKSADGLVRLTENEIIMEFGASALQEKRDASPRVIPYQHVLNIDYPYVSGLGEASSSEQVRRVM
jgi:hypothetical protein